MTQTIMEKLVASNALDQVPLLTWGIGKDCTFAGALEAAMAVTAHAYSYTDIMGFSGLAFRTRWFKPKNGIGACCSCAVGEMEEATDAIARATGWPLRVEFHLGDPNIARRADIVASIDAGKPVVAYGDHLDMGVIYGYRHGGETLLLRDYHKGEAKFEFPASKLGWLWFFLGDYKPVLSRREAFIEGLRIASHNWRRVTGSEGPGEYWYGFAAYDAWCEVLAEFDQLDAEAKPGAFQTNRVVLNSLLDARKAAVAFLRERADLLREAARNAVHRAADSYVQIVDLLESRVPGNVETLSDWTPEVRQSEQLALRGIREFEEAAIPCIEQAIASDPVGNNPA